MQYVHERLQDGRIVHDKYKLQLAKLAELA
jgi:hypothetical protein